MDAQMTIGDRKSGALEKSSTGKICSGKGRAEHKQIHVSIGATEKLRRR